MVVANEPLFPRYLFIRLGQGHADQSWDPIRSTKGVSQLVRFGVSPAKVHDDLIDQLRATEVAVQSKPERLFTEGESICVDPTVKRTMVYTGPNFYADDVMV